jgi:hypothetical protein
MASVILALLCGVTSVAVLLGSEAAAVPACSYERIDDPHERVMATKYLPELVLIGIVINEDLTDELPTSGGGPQELYTSTVRPLAVLRGEMPGENIKLTKLNGIGADCRGGPRLQAGEKVLLFLGAGL